MSSHITTVQLGASHFDPSAIVSSVGAGPRLLIAIGIVLMVIAGLLVLFNVYLAVMREWGAKNEREAEDAGLVGVGMNNPAFESGVSSGAGSAPLSFDYHDDVFGGLKSDSGSGDGSSLQMDAADDGPADQSSASSNTYYNSDDSVSPTGESGWDRAEMSNDNSAFNTYYNSDDPVSPGREVRQMVMTMNLQIGISTAGAVGIECVEGAHKRQRLSAAFSLEKSYA